MTSNFEQSSRLSLWRLELLGCPILTNWSFYLLRTAILTRVRWQSHCNSKLFRCVSRYLCVCMHVHMGVYRVQKSVFRPPNLVSQAVVRYSVWALGADLENQSTRAEHALSQAASPASMYNFDLYFLTIMLSMFCCCLFVCFVCVCLHIWGCLYFFSTDHFVPLRCLFC